MRNALFALAVVISIAVFYGLPYRSGNTVLQALVSVFIGANVTTWVAFYLDKRRAGQPGAVRVSENTLFVLAVTGGLPSTLLAMQVLKHKRSKRRFKWALLGWCVGVYTGVAVIYWLFTQWDSVL